VGGANERKRGWGGEKKGTKKSDGSYWKGKKKESTEELQTGLSARRLCKKESSSVDKKVWMQKMRPGRGTGTVGGGGEAGQPKGPPEEEEWKVLEKGGGFFPRRGGRGKMKVREKKNCYGKKIMKGEPSSGSFGKGGRTNSFGRRPGPAENQSGIKGDSKNLYTQKHAGSNQPENSN